MWKWGMEKSDESRTRRDERRRKYSKMDKRAKDKLVRSPRENEGGQEAQKYLHSRTGRDEKKGKTQEKMERRSRKRSSSAGSKKMERVVVRQEKMEGHFSKGQSPQWAVVAMEEEEDVQRASLTTLVPSTARVYTYGTWSPPLTAFLVITFVTACNWES